MPTAVAVQLPGYPFQNLLAVVSIAALRAIPSLTLVEGQNIAVNGGTVIGDGAGGFYVWSDLSTANDDGVKTIKPTDTPSLAAGRWILFFGTPFGAPILATLATLATHMPAVDETALYIARFSAASQYAIALYVKVAANPGHALSGQAADGTWWEIGEQEITVEMAGHIVGDNIKTSFQIANALGRTVRFLAKTYLTKDTRIFFGGTITGTPGHVIKPFDTDNSASSSNYGFACFADNLTIDGLNCQGQAAVVDTITNGLSFLPPLYAWIGIIRQTAEGGNLRHRNVRIINNICFGAQHGISATAIEDSEISNNHVHWNHYWGIVMAGNCYNVKIDGNHGAYIGENEVVRIGATNNTGDIMDNIFITNNHAEHSGWLLPIPSARQNSYDLFCYNARNIVFDSNTSYNSTGGCLETKTSYLGNTLGSQRYEKLTVTNNKSFQHYGVMTHYAFRHDSQGIPDIDPLRRATGYIIENNTAQNDLYTAYYNVPVNAIAVTVGLRTVVVTHVGHGGQNGDYMMIRGITTPIGGIPAHNLMTYAQIARVDADHYSYTVDTAATATATGGSGTGVIAYEHFRTPVVVPNSLTSSTNQVIRMTIPNHGASVTDNIDITGAVGFAGFTDAALNRRFDIRVIVDANTIEFHTGVLATATVAGGGGANVAYRLHKDGQSAAAFWIQAIDNTTIKGNVSVDVDQFALLEGNTDGVNPAEPLINCTINDNKATGGRYFALFNRGYIDNCNIKNNDFEGYGSFAAYGSGLIAPREGQWSGNRSRVRNGMTYSTGTFWYGRSLFNIHMKNNDHEGDGLCLYDQVNSGVGEGNTGCKIFRNDFKVGDPGSSGTTIPALQIMRLDGGGSWQIQFNRMITGAVTVATLITTAGAPTFINYENERGGSVALPTIAGSLGDVVLANPATVATSAWKCTTPGGVGVVVWTGRG